MKTLLIATALVCALRATAVPAPQSEGAGSGTYRIGGGVSPPTVVHRVQPEYTTEAKSARLEGKVLLGVVISKEGKVTIKRTIAVELKNKDTSERSTSDHGLLEKAKEAVLQWEFKPGHREGQAVEVQANIEVNFRLE